MARSLTLRPPAKINLSLRVGGRRPDGFHDVRTVLQSIALSDRLVATARRGPFVLDVRGAGVPADRTNLVWRAAEALWRALGRSGDPCDARLTLEKQVPVGAGLGGGSANAAATLVGLNRIWNARRTLPDLARLAAELGADVPFFLHGGTAIGLGRGDELYPVDDIRRFGVVIVKPSFAVATVEAYRWFDEDRRVGTNAPVAVEPAVDVDVGWGAWRLAIGNDLAGPVSRRHPELGAISTALREGGALGAAMTGSGSAVFGLFSEAAAKTAARRLRRPDWLVWVTRTVTRREALRRAGL